jgi:predicted DNA-binding transcriptional regulator YafY
MRRADRLFEIVQFVRGRRNTTAEQIAARLEVSLRTVYRDVADLQARGVPIEGEAGVGYRLHPGYTLPPLMFTRDEATALVAAVRLALPRLDTALEHAAEAALSKVLSVLPPTARAAAEATAIHAIRFEGGSPHGHDVRAQLGLLREAVAAQRRVAFAYEDERGRTSQRRVRPLGCFYWGAVWTLAAWCEDRRDFRNFRLDRMTRPRTGEPFVHEAGRTLADFVRAMQQGDEARRRHDGAQRRRQSAA